MLTDEQSALVPHVDEWGDGKCSCGIEEVTPAQQQLLALFDDWYGDKSYRKHREVCRWADKLTKPLLTEIERLRAEVRVLSQSDGLHVVELETELAQANAKLAEARAAAKKMTAALVAVSSLLEVPYIDDPALTPWSRFVHPAWVRLDAALQIVAIPAGGTADDHDQQTGATPAVDMVDGTDRPVA